MKYTIEDIKNEFESPIAKISKWVSNMTTDRIENKTSFSQDYRYIEVAEVWSCHYVSFGNLALMIPSEYSIDYSSGRGNDFEYGNLQFIKDKEYSVEYLYMPVSVFESKISELEMSVDLIDSFVTETGRKFYEFKNDGMYAYINDYMWKISGYSKENIAEYYNMYSILMSICNAKEEISVSLKAMYVSNRQALESLGDVSIDLTPHIENNEYQEVLDEGYHIYKRKSRALEKVTNEIEIYYDDKWCFKGDFQAGILGRYQEGEILDFSEISESDELSEIDKKEMLAKIIEQRQLSISEAKDTIRDSLLLILCKELKNRFTFDMFQEYEMINFIKIENILMLSKTESEIYQFIKKEIDNYSEEDFKVLQSGENNAELYDKWKQTVSYIDSLSFEEMVIPISVKVSPEFVLFGCRIFDKSRYFILMDSNNLIEWN